MKQMKTTTYVVLGVVVLSILILGGCTNQGEGTKSAQSATDTVTGNSVGGNAETPAQGTFQDSQDEGITQNQPIIGSDVTETVVEADEDTDQDASAPVKEVTLEAYNFGFTMSPLQIKKGDRVRLTFKSTSGTHGLLLPAFGVDTGAVFSGDEKTVEFVADKAGSFDYRCNVPCGSGHRDMKGAFVVTE